jgi:HEAT repeat protein
LAAGGRRLILGSARTEGRGRAVPRLIAVLRNPNEDKDMRHHAAAALAHPPDDTIADALIECLDDASPQVRYWRRTRSARRIRSL